MTMKDVAKKALVYGAVVPLITLYSAQTLYSSYGWGRYFLDKAKKITEGVFEPESKNEPGRKNAIDGRNRLEFEKDGKPVPDTNSVAK